MFRLGFDQNKITNLVERLVLHCNIPTLFGATCFSPAHFVHDVLPVAFGKIRVAVLQIDLGDLQVHRRLLAGFVLHVNETASGFSVAGFEAFPLFGEGVEGIINPVFPPENMVPLFHGSYLLRASHRIVPTC
jgi:hypothetical protein